MAWLMVGLITFPAAMSTLALGTYLASAGGVKAGGNRHALGLEWGLPAALLLGALAQIFLTPDRANPYEYRELMNRVSEGSPARGPAGVEDR